MDKNPAARIGGAVAKGAKKSLGTIWFLLKIMVPTSLVVALLGWSGLLSHMARFLAPLMKLIGLPGERAAGLHFRGAASTTNRPSPSWEASPFHAGRHDSRTSVAHRPQSHRSKTSVNEIRRLFGAKMVGPIVSAWRSSSPWA
jgi:spore maturation protein SpmB